jgi:hypothetical protein
LARRDVSGSGIARTSAARRSTARTIISVSSAAAAASTSRRNSRFNPHVLVLTTFGRSLDRGGKARFSFLADFELGFAVENLDLTNILLGHMAGAADQRDQPFGIGIILAASR